MKPNEHLKSMMRGRRKALTMYNEMDSDVQTASGTRTDIEPVINGEDRLTKKQSLKEIGFSQEQVFLNELARVYERDRTTAVMFMVSAKRELQRKQLPDIRA